MLAAPQDFNIELLHRLIFLSTYMSWKHMHRLSRSGPCTTGGLSWYYLITWLPWPPRRGRSATVLGRTCFYGSSLRFQEPPFLGVATFLPCLFKAPLLYSNQASFLAPTIEGFSVYIYHITPAYTTPGISTKCSTSRNVHSTKCCIHHEKCPITWLKLSNSLALPPLQGLWGPHRATLIPRHLHHIFCGTRHLHHIAYNPKIALPPFQGFWGPHRENAHVLTHAHILATSLHRSLHCRWPFAMLRV